MKKIIRCFWAGLAFGILCPAQIFAADPVRIGLLAPLSGQWASEGLEMKQVVELLAEQRNDKGGVLGRRIEIVVEDDAGDPQTAVQAAERLAARRVAVVIGTYGSSVTAAAQDIFHHAGIVQIANGATAVALSQKGMARFFRTCPRDDDQGKKAAQVIMSSGARRVAILHDGTAYSTGLAEETRAGLVALGLEVTAYEGLNSGGRDLRALLTKIKASGPDLVFYTGYYPEAGLLLRQKKEMGLRLSFMGGDAVNNPELLKIAGVEAAVDFRFISPLLPKDLDLPESKRFSWMFTKKYGAQPQSVYALLAGDGLLAALEAISGCGSDEPGQIAAWLKSSLQNYPGVTGPLSFTKSGDRAGNAYHVYRIAGGGQFVPAD